MSQGMFVQRLANRWGRMIDVRPKLSDFEGQRWASREAEEAESFEAPFKPKHCACVTTRFSTCVGLCVAMNEDHFCYNFIIFWDFLETKSVTPRACR